MLRPEWSQDQIKEILETGFDILMSDLFETSYEKAVQFTQHLDVKLLAVKIKPNKPKIGILLYDGRYADNVTDKAPLCYLLVSANGREARRVSQIHDLPSLARSTNNGRTGNQSLRKLLNSSVYFPTPRDPTELVNLFLWDQPPKDIQITVSIVSYALKNVIRYGSTLRFGNPSAPKTVRLRARPGTRYNFTFSLMPLSKSKYKFGTEKATSLPQASTKALLDVPVLDLESDPSTWPSQYRRSMETLVYCKKTGLMNDFQIGVALEDIRTSSQRCSLPEAPRCIGHLRQSKDPNKRNRSAATKIFRKKLNFAFDLGILSKNELHSTSAVLGRTVAALICGYNLQGKLVRLAYADRDDFFDTEVNSSNWETHEGHFFSRMEERRKALENERRQALVHILAKLSIKSGSSSTSLFACCEKNLQQSIQKQHLLIYSPADEDLHNLRYIFGKYAVSQHNKGLCRIKLVFSPKNDICSLNLKNLYLFNVANVLELHRCDTFSESSVGARNSGDRPDLFATKASEFGKKLLAEWQKFGQAFLSWFNYDVNAVSSHNLVQHSYQAIKSRLLEFCGPMHQGVERLKPFYSEILREHSKGGFAFSDRCAVAYGDPINSEATCKAATALEIDLVSAYGYSAKESLLPSGFCVGLVSRDFQRKAETGNYGLPSSGDTEEAVLYRRDSLRSESFEFRAVYYTLWKLISEGHHIRTVFSNYHSHGVFQIKKCILDLAVIFQDGSIFMANFDSAFTHGCPRCDPLERYVNGETLESLICKTERRDSVIRGWISDCGLDQGIYRVLTDCHHVDYSPAKLAGHFKREPQLRRLLQSVPKDKRYTTEQLLHWLTAHRTDRSFTFLAWIRGSATGHPSEVTPVVKSSGDRSRGSTLVRFTGPEPVLVTREYFEYLNDWCGFKIEGIEAVLFFGVDTHTSAVFSDLVNLRMNETSLPYRTLFKHMTNFTVGYFGVNFTKAKPRYCLTNCLPRNFKAGKHEIVCREQRYEEDFIMYSIAPSADLKREALRNNTLAVHVAVVENAKLRLIRFVNFLQSHLTPGTFRLLYSNTDNLHLVLASPNISELVAPHRRVDFVEGVAEYLNDSKAPGCFQLKWQTKGEFRYATGKLQNYAVLCSGCKEFKCSGVNSVDPERGYDFTLKLLADLPAELTQTRRVCKQTGLKTVEKTLVFRPG